jgi:hypothetical protein
VLTLPASSANKRFFDFRFRGNSAVENAGATARVIANLHDIIVDPGVEPGTVAVAKGRLLAVLERTKEMRLPQMVIPTFVDKQRPWALNPNNTAGRLCCVTQLVSPEAAAVSSPGRTMDTRATQRSAQICPPRERHARPRIRRSHHFPLNQTHEQKHSSIDHSSSTLSL